MATQLCIYCQSNVATTKDHVPPKCLFTKPRPQLVTVPACVDCNAGASTDDEDFRLALVSRRSLDGSTAAERLREVTHRAFDHRPSYLEGWLRQTRIVDDVDHEGNIVGEKMQLLRDGDRLARVVDRTVRGLHYSIRAMPLPVGYPILVMDDEGFDPQDYSSGTMMGDFIETLMAAPANIIHPDVFSYWRHQVVDVPIQQAWLLKFYKRHWFIALVGVNRDDYISATTQAGA